MLVLEVRGPEGKGSINQKGNYQGTLMGLEMARFTVEIRG
jgi:hypothetical protein